VTKAEAPSVKVVLQVLVGRFGKRLRIEVLPSLHKKPGDFVFPVFAKKWHSYHPLSGADTNILEINIHHPKRK